MLVFCLLATVASADCDYWSPFVVSLGRGDRGAGGAGLIAQVSVQGNQLVTLGVRRGEPDHHVARPGRTANRIEQVALIIAESVALTGTGRGHTAIADSVEAGRRPRSTRGRFQNADK